MKENSLSRLSDSDLSSQLSDASTLSSDSDSHDILDGHSDSNEEGAQNHRRFSDTKRHHKSRKKTAMPSKKTVKHKMASKKKTKERRRSLAEASSVAEVDDSQYCICRQGYDGKEFMIACDGCQEWFHGRCVGIKPKFVTEHYFCDACKRKAELKQDQAEAESNQRKGTKGKGRSKKGKQQTSGRRKNKKTTEETLKQLPAPVVVKVSRNEDEDIDDICPVCDTECTCGSSDTKLLTANDENSTANTVATDIWEVTNTSNTVVERLGHEEPKHETKNSKGRRKTKKSKKKKETGPQKRKESTDRVRNNIVIKISNINSDKTRENGISRAEDDEDRDSVYAESRADSYCSSVHIDSGDDEDIEKEEERAIIEELMDHEEDLTDYDESDGYDSVEKDDRDQVEDYYYIEDDDEEVEEAEAHGMRMISGWISSDEEDEDEELDMFSDLDNHGQEDDVTTHFEDGNGALFDSIAAAFLQILAPLAQNSEVEVPAHSTDIVGSELDLTGLDLAAITAGLNGDQTAMDRIQFDRRPSLPSSAVTAAHNQAPDELTSEALSALSTLTSEGSLTFPLSLNTKEETSEMEVSGASNRSIPGLAPAGLSAEDLKFHEQLLQLVKTSSEVSVSANAAVDFKGSEPGTGPSKRVGITPTGSRHILPKPVFEASATTSSSSLDQDSSEKRRASDIMSKGKKRRVSIAKVSSNMGAQAPEASVSSPSSSAESEPTPVSMDDLLDTSQLYTRSSSRSPSPDPDELNTRFSRDLSRWQRVPIGAFRLMRSENKSWLHR